MPGKLPPFIESLLPEGWLAQVLHQRDARDALKQGKRYMSNITVVLNPRELRTLPDDILQASLGSWTREGEFTGRYEGPGRGQLDEDFEQNLARLFERSETPRLSGVQIKMPMALLPDGRLVPAVDQPFTHILKPAGTSGFEPLPVMEWFCLQLAKAAGFEVPPSALVPMPDGMPPALVVERFDIRQNPEDQRLLALEDFCSVLDVPASSKYDVTIERVARGLRPLSTAPEEDLMILFRRALFAWLVADGDMHLKNLALLKTAALHSTHFAIVRFAPVYDAVTTRVFPGLAGDRMALKLAGRDDRLTSRDFTTLAQTMELPSRQAEAERMRLATVLPTCAQDVHPPRFSLELPSVRKALEGAKDIVLSRSEVMQS